MKIFREDGKRIRRIILPDGRGMDLACDNHKDCAFCENCQFRCNISNPNNPKLKLECKIPCMVSEDNNCVIQQLNKNHSCPNFKDVDENDKKPDLVRVKKTREQRIAEAPAFNINKDGVSKR